MYFFFHEAYASSVFDEGDAKGIGVGVASELIGYASQDKPFDPKRFLRTVAIQTLATLGLVVTGISGDVYSSAVGPTAVTVFVQKIWGCLTDKPEKS